MVAAAWNRDLDSRRNDMEALAIQFSLGVGNDCRHQHAYDGHNSSHDGYEGSQAGGQSVYLTALSMARCEKRS